MSASGFTPIQLYYSTTNTNVPSNANLLPGELGFNIHSSDFSLYAENSAGTVTRLMNNPAGLKYPTADGTANQVVVTNGSGVLSFASVPTLAGTNTWTGAQTFTNSLMKLLGSSTGVTTFASANAGASNYTITFPAATVTVASLTGTETLTNKTIAAATNNVEARSLQSASTTVNVSAATAPSAGQVLTATSSTAATWQSSSALGALVLLATATPTAAANVDFLTTFTSTYDSYLIIAEGLVPNGSQSPLMRFAVAGVVDTGSVYFTPGESLTTGAVTALTIGPQFYVSGQGGTCEITVQNVNDTVRMKTGFARCVAETTAGQVRFQSSGIAYNAANAISGFRLYWASGASFVAVGKVRVYGIINA